MKLLLWLLTCSIVCLPSIQWSIKGITHSGQLITTITQTLDPGWHSYWKNPGESGAKASIISTNPDVTFDTLQFPKPSIITIDPFVTFGYKSTVNYTLPITIKNHTTPVTATFHWLECADVCIPKSKNITLTIPETRPSIIGLPIAPKNTVYVKQVGKKLMFSLSDSVTTAEFFPYTNSYLNFNQVSFKNNILTINLTNDAPKIIEGELYINNNPSPIIINTQINQIKKENKRLLFVLLGAFIGGLLLNIMPCVLPIIGIKAIQLSNTPSKQKVKDAALYFLGILVSLYTLFFGLIIIKSTGTLVGWGFQLQSPIMIQTLIILFLILLFINLDLLLIQGPSKFINKKSNNFFWSGVLTTLIATPCTAPFLGTALSVALLKSTLIGSLIFLLISIGLALPVCLIICFPVVKKYLPTTGKWSHQFKYILSFGFTITIIWLAWVLTSQVDIKSQIIFYSISLSVLLFMIYRSYIKNKKIMIKIIPILISIIGIITVLLYHPSSSKQWIPYSTNLIQKYEQNHTPYFIDITAKWCVTCQSNKLFVLNSKEIKQLFFSNKINTIQADWTNYDEDITTLLERFDQISIPTYIYFDGKNHHIFGNIITKETVKEIIKPKI